MTLEQNIFERAKVDWHKLLTYGFKKSGSEWVYCKTFMNGEFKAVVKINKSGYVSGDVFEIDSDDVYFPLRVESMAQGFAGEVRTEYESILKDIKKN
ncbi:MAG: MmcQ family protein, partial [Alphaproteobacteria bacterium]|nr:MmcQ family protein [Alphaproteobacteria bacterium]